MKQLKIAILRGSYLNQWDSYTYLEMNHDADVTMIGSHSCRFNISKLEIKKKLLYGVNSIVNNFGYLSVLLNYFLNINDYLFNLRKTLSQYDVVDTAEINNPFSYQAIRGHRVVICNCYENIPFFKEFGLTKIYKDYNRAHAAHFIAVTEKAKSVLELEGVSSEKISVIPPGIDLSLFRPAHKDIKLLKQYNLKNSDINILFAGRIVYDKGIEDLAYAFKLLCDKHDNVKLLIVGNGKWKNKIINILKSYGIEKNVRFLGFLPYEQTEKFYNLSDIFCTPSRITKYWQEQFGFVFAEAMACGKAIVSTHAGSIPEVTAGNALLVSPGNHLELYEALDRLVKSKKLREDLGRKAKKFAQEHYDVKIIAKKRLELYKMVYNESRKGSE